MFKVTQEEFELVKAGAFSVYSDAGIPENQWEQKLASYIDAANRYERAIAVIPLVKQALAEKQARKATK